jgi:regulator of protease activity HflC (stomatin/prohibitin superfamily)
MRNKIALALFTFLFGCIGITNVDPGNVGVEVNRCSGGGVSKDPLPVGYQFTGPCTDIYEYPTSMQTYVLSHSHAEGGANDDSISTPSSEGLVLKTDVALSYNVEAAKVPAIYTKFKSDLHGIESTYIRNFIREGMRNAFSKYTAEQLYAGKQEIARLEVEKFLNEKLRPEGFVITNFSINNIKMPDSVVHSIEAKVTMTQQAQQAENEVRKKQALADQQVAEAEGQAKVLLIKAKSEAAAKQLKADAEAAYIKKVNESLTTTFVQYSQAIKWDGKLPSVTAGNTPIIDLRK